MADGTETDAATPPHAEPNGGETTGPTDHEVGQHYFDDEMASIHEQLNELKQAMAHLAASVQAGAESGHTADQSSDTSGVETGQGGGTAGGDELEPEHSPAPSHRWWRPLRG